MSISFEEMADAGVPDEVSPVSSVGRSKVLIFVVLFCVVTAAFGMYYYFFYYSQSDLPEAAEILLSAEGEVPGVLPHSLDSSTEFEESFDYLKEGEAGPEYRATEEVSTAAETSIVDVADDEVLVEEVEVVAVTEVNQVEMAPAPVVVLDRAPAVVTKVTLSEDAEVVFDRDWGGVVLVPDTAKLAKAYTSNVRLSRVEAHPIDGERLRVWARIQNLTDMSMTAEVGCEFRSSQYTHVDGARFEPMMILAGGFVDVQFVSPQDRVESYTVMVKGER